MAYTSVKVFVQDIKEQIWLGELETALEMFRNYLIASNHKLQNELILHFARYNRLKAEQRQGILGRKEAEIQYNQIASAILEMLRDLSETSRDQPLPFPLIVKDTAFTQQVFDFKQEKILGINNLKQISWIRQAINVSRSVCRVLTPNGFGTGFLIGHDQIMTNNHVISNKEIAVRSFAEFNYEQGSSGEHLPSFRFSLNPEIFHTSPFEELDYTIVGINFDHSETEISQSQWGHLYLNPDATPVPNEHVIVIQHPNGGLKQIALTANRVVNTRSQYIYYTTDTMPGSSGSPIFNDLWQVIGIHHAYGGIKQDNQNNNFYANEGILMSHIKLDAQDFWPVYPKSTL